MEFCGVRRFFNLGARCKDNLCVPDGSSGYIGGSSGLPVLSRSNKSAPYDSRVLLRITAGVCSVLEQGIAPQGAAHLPQADTGPWPDLTFQKRK